ncbi:MAG: hypothetical protein J6U00_08915 [Ruminococcus sp.]|uniref:hypothetical protein n=1 Tax=Ruminococcus sp. TaxID=41978 RepID=UPI001B2507C8|nr:hypothetical protein [Ruminococcus sp.]MBO7474102.1 hypothetical protein [Ruminococcus sp.]
MSYLNELAEKWAKENAINEAEAFEYAIRSTNIKGNDSSRFEAFREGYRKGVETAQENIDMLLKENNDLKRQLKSIQEIQEMYKRLRETIRRGQEDYYE